MYSYIAYGLGIHASFRLPELVGADTDADVIIYRDEAAPLPPEAAGQARYVRVTPGEALLAFDQVGAFLLSGGGEVQVIPAPGAEERLLRLALVGVVMAVILYQRGRLVLHASSVAFGNGCVAFMGESGWGKSTLAAALHACGYPIVADDTTAVEPGAAAATVWPAFPQVKLSIESAAALGYDPESLVTLHPLEPKRGCRLAAGFESRPLPLRRVYVLAESDRLRIERLQPGAAMVELLCHSYPNRLQQPASSQHFFQCAQLAREIPIYRLGRPRALLQLRDLARAVASHLADDAAPLAEREVGTPTELVNR